MISEVQLAVTETIEILLLSVSDWQRSLPLMTAALSRPGSDIFLVDPEKSDDEIFALELLASRLPLRITDATGHAAFGQALRTAPELRVATAPEQADFGAGLSRLGGPFGPPAGLVCAPAADPARCLKGAVLAVRLGFIFLPCGGAGSETSELSSICGSEYTGPLIWLGREEPPAELSRAAGSARITALPGDGALAEYMLEQGLQIDYLLLYNSADLVRETAAPLSPGQAWVRGLSLLAPLCASYRSLFPFDAEAEQPAPALIEEELNRFAAEAGLHPAYMAILASPGAIPLLYEPQRTIGSTTEELARDIHLRLNDDLFFDTAEGRLFQSSPGGLSAQLLSTKYFHRLQGMQSGEGKRMLVAASPEIDYKIIFNSDDPLLESQFVPHLESCGHRVTILEGKEASAARISRALEQSDFFLFAGHGTTEALKTCGRFLTRRDLPALPPLVAYASACTTAGMDPYWSSASDGLDWESIPVPYRDQFGLAMVEKGALCYVGGSTMVDLQFATSIYPLFFEKLLVKGLSVGQALRETRNFVSLYASIMQQKAPERYGCYKWWTAAALQQQTLLGDPALVPAPRERSAETALPRTIDSGKDRFALTLTIPQERWRRSCKPINAGAVTQSYYRTRSVEVISPYGDDVISWGDFYRLAPDAGNSAARAVMSSYIHLYLDLPLSQMPLQLKLTAARGDGCRCLLCDQEIEPPRETADMFQDFRVPFLMMPPVRFDYREGWAFAVEELENCNRVHWLAPLLAIDDATRSAVRAAELTFELLTGAAQTLSGRIDAPQAGEGCSCLVSAGSAARPAGDGGAGPEKLDRIMARALTRPGGSFSVKCAAAANALTIDGQFPLYDILEPYRAFKKEIWPLRLPEPVCAEPENAVTGKIHGRVLDAATAAPLPGALVRAWRGVLDPSGDLMTEGFAGEARAGADGAFTLTLPAGEYRLYAVAQSGGVNYRSRDFAAESAAGDKRYLVLPLDAGARVRGRVAFAGEPPLYPVNVYLKRYRNGAPGETLTAVPVGRDGGYACLVAAGDCFCLEIREEGWKQLLDTNSGRGFRLQPGEEITLDWTLEPAGS